MNIFNWFLELTGWHDIKKYRPTISRFYKVCDINNHKNVAFYNICNNAWDDDCSEFGLDELVYWKEWE